MSDAKEENFAKIEQEIEEFIKQYDRYQIVGNRKILVSNTILTPTKDKTIKKISCDSYISICKRYAQLNGGERFYGEKVALGMLAKFNDNAGLAWEEILAFRKTYKGLREQDRNAEHYLDALSQVRYDNKKWGTYQISTPLYHIAKFYSNVAGKLNENLGGNNFSRFRGSPPTIDELKAGYFGANDAINGIPY